MWLDRGSTVGGTGSLTHRYGRRTARGPAALGVALALVSAGCRSGEEAFRASGPAPAPTASVLAQTQTSSPPPVVVSGGGRELRLVPWSFCWSGPGAGVCADGRPPEDPPDIGDPGQVDVAFPATGFGFVATAERHGVRCGRSESAPLQPTGETTWRLSPLGPAGDYDVTLAGRSTESAPDKGDLAVTFRWHTPRAGASEPPAATASVLAGQPGDVRSDGVELAVHDLRTTPAAGQASARVVVTSANGASLPVDLERRTSDCVPEGSVFFTGAKQLGDRAATLGPAPFRYDVSLVLDGVTYRGTGAWPDDVDPACAPCTRLRFDPPLPGL